MITFRIPPQSVFFLLLFFLVIFLFLFLPFGFSGFAIVVVVAHMALALHIWVCIFVVYGRLWHALLSTKPYKTVPDTLTRIWNIL